MLTEGTLALTRHGRPVGPDCGGEGGHGNDSRFQSCDGRGASGHGVEVPREAAVHAFADTNGREPHP